MLSENLAIFTLRNYCEPPLTGIESILFCSTKFTKFVRKKTTPCISGSRITDHRFLQRYPRLK
jgi:hypothetical protein